MVKGDISTEEYNKLGDFLMLSDGFVPIEEAMKEAEKKWPRNQENLEFIIH